MADWVRPLFPVPGATGRWHAPRIKGVNTTAYCGENIVGALEIASEDKAQREGRCPTCVTRLAAKSETVLPRPRRPRARGVAVPKAAAQRKKTVKRSPAKKTTKRPAAKKRAGKAAAKAPARRPRRGRA